MSGFKGTWPSVLSGAIDAARAVLLDLEGADIPASLSRVAAYQGGRLPPPLAGRLLKEIDENDWFREKVASDWEGEPGDPSDLFLSRPGGWWLELAAAVDAAGAGREDRRVADLEARLERVEVKRAAAANKAREYKKAVAAAGRTAKEMATSAREAAELKYSAEIAETASVRKELEIVEQRLADLELEHGELQQGFHTLRSRYSRARRGRFEEPERRGGSGSVPADPVKLARLLDLQAADFGRDLRSRVVAHKVESEPLALAPGVRPDSSDAIRWLIGLGEAAVLIVDGYNAQFHIDRGDFTSGAARRRLIDALKRLRSTAAAKHRIVVVYDSTLPGDRVARTSAGGVEVRFAEDDRIADEEIVNMSGNLENAVVISSDREVREGAEENGSVVLWSEALEQWLNRA